MTTTKVLGAFLLGGAVGASLGVLYAPDKGSNTRKNIIGKKDELLEEAESKVEEGMDEVKSKYKEGKQKFADKMEESKEKFADKVEEGKEKLGDLTSKSREKTDGVKSGTEDTKFKTRQTGYSSANS